MKKTSNRMRRLLAALTVLATGAAGAGLGAESTVPYFSYTYNDWAESIPTAAAYEPDQVMMGALSVPGGLDKPIDMAVQDGLVYVLDRGHKRVVVLDSDLAFLREVNAFTQDGTTVELGDPVGIAVDTNGRIVIADQGNKQVVVADSQGNVQVILTRPDSDLIPKSVDFLPQKVLVDRNGVLYVLSQGIYQGALSFDSDGSFLGFFGSNLVSQTDKLMADRLWRLISTQEQKDKMVRYVPVEYQNFALGTDNFIYTVSNYEDDSQKGQVKKLNPLSQNILWAGKKPSLGYFGDLERIWTGRLEKSRLTAVDVDADGFISVLDLERGRIFQYDQMSNLITIFGGKADQAGCFRNPVAIASLGKNILVLDESKSSITSFRLTDLGEAIHVGTVLYNNGMYQEALAPWEQALKKDSFSWLALRGKARALERLGRYTEAMDLYRQSDSHGSYSNAYFLARQKSLRDNFGWYALAALLVIGGLVAFFVWRGRNRRPEDRIYKRGTWEYPWYVLMHPVKGFEEMRHDRKGSLLFANIVLAAWLVVLVIQYQFTGYQFNMNRLSHMNILLLMVPSIFAFAVAAISNWAVSTLQDGKGKMRDIWIFGAYALLPQVLFAIPLVILSNVFYQGEGFFLGLGATIMNGWTLLMLLMAVKAVQQYDMKKTIISILLTIIGVLLVVIVIILFYSLFAQLFNFGHTIVQELIMRS